MSHVDLILGSEVVVLLDRFGCDWSAFLAARIESYVKYRGCVPDRLTILQRRSQYVTVKRIAELEYLYKQIREAE